MGPDSDVVDVHALERAADRLREARVGLPTFAQLADPGRIPGAIRAELAGVGPDDPNPLNLFRAHWYNGANRIDLVDVPDHLVLPRELTGIDAAIVVALGDRFPLIRAPKKLAVDRRLSP